MTTDVHGEHAETQGSFLSKQRIIAHPGFNRWLVPPAALAIHLCIGMAYGILVAVVQSFGHQRSHQMRA
jgi:hypothetical protein